MSERFPRGEWVTFHRYPVYGPACHAKCAPKKGGHGGYAEVGQIAGLAAALFWGRAVYRIRYWHPQPNGRLEALEVEVSVDRIIARTRPPRDLTPLITPEPATQPARGEEAAA